MNQAGRAAVAALVLGLNCSAAEPAAARDGARPAPSLDLLLRQFETLAFSNEFGGAHRRGRLVKWNQPIRVQIRGFNAERYRFEVSGQLAQLARLTGLNIEFTAGGIDVEPANMVITFVSRRQGFDPKAACATYIYDRGFAINRVEIFITADIPELRRHCIAEEITQALGLANDSTVFKESIFNDWSRRQSLAPWDALMIRVLYHPRLHVGMHKARAMPVVRRILVRMMNGKRQRIGRR